MLLVAHPVLLWAVNPAILSVFNPVTALWHITAGTGSLLAVVAVTTLSLLRRRVGIEYDRWRVGHTALAVAAVGLAIWHVQGVGYHVAGPWKKALWAAIGGSIAGVGNARSPLDGVGSRLTAEGIRKWIVAPREMNPKVQKRPYDRLPPVDLDALTAYLLSLKRTKNITWYRPGGSGPTARRIRGSLT